MWLFNIPLSATVEKQNCGVSVGVLDAVVMIVFVLCLDGREAGVVAASCQSIFASLTI